MTQILITHQFSSKIKKETNNQSFVLKNLVYKRQQSNNSKILPQINIIAILF